LNRAFLFFPGEPILVADTAQRAGVLVGELGDIQASTWHVGGGLLGAHFAGPLFMPDDFGGCQRPAEVRSRFSPLNGFSQVASPQNC